MVIDRASQLIRTGELSNVEFVGEFIYLGSLLTDQGGSKREIKRRTQMAKAAMSKLTRIWQDRKVSNATKMRLVRTLVFSIFLYGADSWTARTTERKKIEALVGSDNCAHWTLCCERPERSRKPKQMEADGTKSHEGLSGTRPSAMKYSIKKKNHS
ncbi:uncharacterized protein LOC134199067 [Bombyx mori]|uniref:uncharacterized protein LOC134199067 n=1 Tax=Bombyx mori TaxID=7091 RepID=UPI002ED24012